MNAKQTTRTSKAACLCGQAEFDITLPVGEYPLKAYFCHCDSCRHLTGTLCYTLAFLPIEFQPQTTFLDTLTKFPFSKRIDYYSCPECGSQMLAGVVTNVEDPNSSVKWGVATGVLKQADGVFQVGGHEHLEDTLDGGFSDFCLAINGKAVERWPDYYREKGREQLPLDWTAESTEAVKGSDQPRLHAHCKCGGVEFWLSRPTGASLMGEAPWPDVLVRTDSEAPLPPDDIAWWLRDGGTKYLGGICACDSCRLATGMEWAEWAFVPTANISLDAKGVVPFSRQFGTLKHYRSKTRPATRYFCINCGATVFWDGDERPQVIDVAVGLLCAPEGARAETWLDWAERLSFREVAIGRAETLVLAVDAALKSYVERRTAGRTP